MTKISQKTNLTRRKIGFFKIGIPKIFVIFTGRHLCGSLFLIELPGYRPATLLKRDSNAVVFL